MKGAKKRAHVAPPILRWKFGDGTTADVPLNADFERAQDAQDRAIAALTDEPILNEQARARIAQRFDALAAQRELRMRRSLDGRKKSLGLTWEKVEATWRTEYAQHRSANRADADTGKLQAPPCSESTIRALRLGAKLKKKRIGARR